MFNDDENNKSIQMDKSAMIFVIRLYMPNDWSLALVEVSFHIIHLIHCLLKCQNIYILNSNLKHQSRLQNMRNFLLLYLNS